jgi:hypothetical protein
MSFILEYPPVERKVVVETGHMRRTANRTLAVHRAGALVAWHGRSRVGKTTTAEWMAKQITEQFDPDNPAAFRALHYEVGEIQRWSGQEQKKGLRSLYHAAIGRLDEGLYRQLPPEDIARQLIFGLKRKSIQMILIDEAGSLSLDAIRGMVLARDTAQFMDWTLSLVFIGMDDLPSKLCQLPQIEKRVAEWCYFVPYTLDETWTLLSELHPHFASLNARKSEHREQVKFIHELYGGLPGEIAPFIQRFSNRLRDHHGDVDLTLLRVVHLSTQRDKDSALKDAKTRYEGNLKDIINGSGEAKSAGNKGEQK